MPRRIHVRYAAAVALIFVVGLCAHLTVLQGRHREGDELIYQTLVQQLSDGHGYTLQGSWLIERHLLGAQYDRPLFHHPPAGVVLFWLFHALLGPAGFAWTQLVSYTLWFFSLMWLADGLALQPRMATGLTTAALAALQPIMSHVVTHYWLDGPLLAVTTLAAACVVWAVRRNSSALAVGAGVVLGLASLIKPTAFLVVPGVLALAWQLRGALTLRRTSVLVAWTVGLAALLHAPWLAWRWSMLGTPLAALQGSSDAGRPAAELIATNAYVRFVTSERPAYCYITLLPRVCWTLVPSLVLSLLTRRARGATETHSLVAPLWFWIASIVGLHVALGYLGYSKVLRYVILVAPASVLLPAVLVARCWPRAEQDPTGLPQRATRLACLAFMALGVGLELVQGVSAALATRAALIEPWFGGLVF
jgi:4-amino-4-deoxy-L-arabinose transferase-like glycosyltransferase